MYHNGIATSNMLKLPTPRGSTTPVTMATAFYLIEKMPSTFTGVQIMQALNLLCKSLSISGSIIRRPIPMRIVDQPVDKSESSAEQTQNPPVTPVSFASSTQVRMDIAVPSPVGQGMPQVPPVWVSLSQITSVASTANIAVSTAFQQSRTSATTQPQQQTEQCRKCGKKNHPTSCCHQKVTCRKCKGKDHIAKFCSTPNQEELKCTFCGKTKHSVENCKARKKAEKKIQKELKAKRTPTVTSTAASTVIEDTTIVPGPAFTDSSASTSDLQNNSASAITSSWHRRKVAVLSQQSQPGDIFGIATTFSSTPHIYVSMK